MTLHSDTVRDRFGVGVMLLFALAALVMITLNAPVAYAGKDDSFEWSGTIARGKTIEIKTVNGDIEARAGSGSQVVVYATKRWRHDDPDEVSIEVIEHDGGVTLCTVYPGRGNSCEPGSGGKMRLNNHDVSVSYVIEVPSGVLFAGRAVNGDVEAQGLDAHVLGITVNGSVDIETDGAARGETVNGSIRAVIGASHWEDNIRFSTVNGRIEVYLPSDTDAEVRAQTVNGGIHTDLPIQVTGTFGTKTMRGTIGDGGGRLSLETVNGSIRLKTR
jgi:hypothetical protein